MTAVITINNTSDAVIYATAESARTILKDESSHEKSLREEAAGGGISAGAKGVQIGAHGNKSMKAEEVRSIAKNYSVVHGPRAGYRKIAPGAQGELRLPGDAVNAYFLTLSDGKNVIAYRASLDSTEHDFIHVGGNGDALHFDASPDRPVITSGASIKLQIQHKIGGEQRFVGMPGERKGWPSGVISTAPGAHMIFDLSNSLSGPIKSGDLIKLKGTVLGDNHDYCFMYSSKAGGVYYDLPSENEKQYWIISKVGGGSGPIRAGDSVLLHNFYWRGAQLRPDAGGHQLRCEAGKDMPFVIDLM